MRAFRNVGVAGFLFFSFACVSFAALRDVNASTATPFAPYANGGMAAVEIQPAFVDAGAGNFRLAPASFCIDAGTANGGPGGDCEGNRRPQIGKSGMSATNCDPGAYANGFHFNEIRTTAANEIQFKGDVEDRGIYRLPAGQFPVHTQAVSQPVAMPDRVRFRLLVSHTPF
ncbi:MAG: hypothetical protein EOM72_01250 [Opitutae bacterium]|nr:hypothetical protein [Opitutae bacterium]